MNVNFQNLDKIDNILELLNTVITNQSNHSFKRWLSTEETGEYLGYSKDSIDSMVKSGVFTKDIHYYQKLRKRMFDKEALDKWVIGEDPVNNPTYSQINSTIDEIVDSIL